MSSYLRVLENAFSAFAAIEEKAEKLRMSELEQLQGVGAKELIDSGLIDEPDDVFRMAASAADDYLIHELDLRQGIVNLFAVGLCHLFEQHIAQAVKLGVIPIAGKFERKFSWIKFKAAARKSGIILDKFDCYHDVTELRDVANCAKHGEGPACENLRKSCPRLLGEFAKINEDIVGLQMLGVTKPLFGEGLCVTHQDVVRYGNAIRQFWRELESAIRASAQKRANN
jgi:hypothetical protein